VRGQDGYGKYAVTAKAPRIEHADIVSSFNEFARRGEDSAAFKNWSGDKPVIPIDDIQTGSINKRLPLKCCL
jgi:hypothetical protein